MTYRLARIALFASAAWIAADADAAIVTATFAGDLNRRAVGTVTGKYSGTATYDTSADTTQALQSGVITSFSISSPVFASL